jgi:hypothetical protein
MLEHQTENVRTLGIHCQPLVDAIGRVLDRRFRRFIDRSGDEELYNLPKRREVLKRSGDAGIEDPVEDTLQPWAVFLGF